MKLSDLFRRKTIDDEATRRARLISAGRIAEGIILDTGTNESGTGIQIYYNYDVGGVSYESSQTLDDDQQARASAYMPGARITIRYAPHQPGNSVVV